MYDFIKQDIDYDQDVVDLRGYIISKTIRVEESIDKLIVSYYHKDWKAMHEFHDDVLKHTNWNPASADLPIRATEPLIS